MNSEWQDGKEDEKEEREDKQADEQFEKKYELLKSASLESLVMEVESESISEPQPLTQETRALTASELLLNKWGQTIQLLYLIMWNIIFDYINYNQTIICQETDKDTRAGKQKLY